MALRGYLISGIILAIHAPIWNTVLDTSGKGMLNSILLLHEDFGGNYYDDAYLRITIDGVVKTYNTFSATNPNEQSIANFWGKINLPFITSLKIEIHNSDMYANYRSGYIDYYIKYIKEI